MLFAILQKYDFSSKSQQSYQELLLQCVVCDTAKVRFFKQITTPCSTMLFCTRVVCDTAKVRFFKQITTGIEMATIKLGCLRYCKSTIFQANHNTMKLFLWSYRLFAILQKYDFSSKSQQLVLNRRRANGCLRYCKSTIFQANHNSFARKGNACIVVCDTAKVRFFKQITTRKRDRRKAQKLFAILQKYDFSSKSQPPANKHSLSGSCLRYCKSTIFQANHNYHVSFKREISVVCDTAKVRFFKQITTD